MNVHSEAARLRANRIGGIVDDFVDDAKQKGAELVDETTQGLAADAKAAVTEKYGSHVGNIVGSALEGVQEEYFAVEGRPMSASQLAEVIRKMNVPALATSMKHGPISPRVAKLLLTNRALLSTGVKGADAITKAHNAALAQKAVAASKRKRNWIIGLSAVGVVGVATTFVVLANKKKKK